MSHPDEGVLEELLDGELAPADEAVVRAHIAGCAPCTTALAALRAAQLEADSIVSRLVLEPRLRRPARRTWPNLRLLGLAASAVLVAGTSWLLLRSPEAAQRPERADTASGIILPLPASEREEVGAAAPANTPAAPQAPREHAAEKKERDDGHRANEADAGNEARSVDAPAAMARMATPSAAPAQLAAGAAKASAAPSVTLADAEERLGKIYTIAGIKPVSVEFLGDSARAVRQRYLVSGVPVVLVQEDLGFNTHDRIPPSRRVTDSAGVQLTTVTWWSGGYKFDLRGALPADSLEALLKQLRQP